MPERDTWLSQKSASAECMTCRSEYVDESHAPVLAWARRHADKHPGHLVSVEQVTIRNYETGETNDA